MDIRREVEPLPPLRLAPGGAYEDLEFVCEVETLHDVVVCALPKGTDAVHPGVSWLHTDLVVEPAAGHDVSAWVDRALLPPASAAYNYFHFVWELCAGAWVGGALADGPVDVLNTSQDWLRPAVAEAMAALLPGWAVRDLDLESNQVLGVRELLVPRFWLRPQGSDDGHFDRPRWAAAGYSRDYIGALRRAFVPNGPDGQVIDAYLPRLDASFRTDPEPDANRAVCDEQDVSVVGSLWGRTMREQAMDFARMRSLVAIHGAANANVCFLPEGAALTEIFAEGYAPGQFQIVADLLDLRYDHIVLPDTPQTATDEPLRRSPQITPDVLRTLLVGAAARSTARTPETDISAGSVQVPVVGPDPSLLAALRPWVRQFEPWWDPDRILEHLRSLWHPAAGEPALSHELLQECAVALLDRSPVSPAGQSSTGVAFDTEDDWGDGRPNAMHLQSPTLHVSLVEHGAVVNLWGRIVVLDATDHVIADLSSEWWWLVAFYAADRSAMARSAPTVASAVLLANDTPSINFAHVVLDQVALAASLHGRVDALRPAADLAFVVGPTTQRWHGAVLDAHLGPFGGPIVPVGWFTAVRAERLWVPGSASLVPHPAYKGASWARDFLGRAAAGDAAGPTPRRIYLHREGFRRRITNIGAGLLAHAGIVPVEIDSLAYRDQARLLRDADLVLADHGAALTHMVHMRPGSHVVELLPTGYSTPAYEILAQRGRVGYTAIPAHPREGDDRHESQRDYVIDAELVAAAIGTSPA
jgi:capsular polysaccharide biosynthesis protein